MRIPAAPPAVPTDQPGKSRRTSSAFRLRGGRLTKIAGETASCSPAFGAARASLLSSAALGGILAGAFLGLTATEARAACIKSDGAWNCTGVATVTQRLLSVDSPLKVNLDSNFDMDIAYVKGHDKGDGFHLTQSGTGGIALAQAANGREIVGRLSAIHAQNTGDGDVSITTTGTLRKLGQPFGSNKYSVVYVLNKDAAGGAVTIRTASVDGSNATGPGHGVEVRNAGTGATSITATGPIHSAQFRGVGVRVMDRLARGEKTASVTISVATVTGRRSGIRVRHRRGGDVSIRATGAVTTSGGARQAWYGPGTDHHAISVLNDDIDSNISVAAATVTALGTGAVDGIYVKQEHGGTVSVSASGAVSTRGRHGIFVDQDGDGAVTVSASGPVAGTRSNAAIKVDAGANVSVRISLESGAVAGDRWRRDTIVETGGNAWVEVKAGAEVKGDVKLGGGNDALSVLGGDVLGDVDLGGGNDSLSVGGGGEIWGDVDFGGGNHDLRLHGGTVADVDLGDGDNDVTFGRGFSTLGGEVRGSTTNITFESGAVGRIAKSASLDEATLVTIKSGAIAILDDLGWWTKLGGATGGIRIEGTLNTADGVSAMSLTQGVWPWLVVLGVDRVHGTTGTWIPDANFYTQRGDALGWNGGQGWKVDLPGNKAGAVLTVEPAITAMGSSKYGRYSALGSTRTTFRTNLPEVFRFINNGTPPTLIHAVIPGGFCRNDSGSVFTCTDLLWRQQSLTASGAGTLDVTLGSTTTFVHALTGKQRGLSLSQTGSGGISLRQTSGRHRIAAAGHAVHAVSSGSGKVSVTLQGEVIGGLTGREPEADGISASAARGAVSVVASSVTGIRHGIAASAGGSGGVDISASGTVIGRFGTGILVTASDGGATVSAAAVTGGEAGIMGSGTGAVSIQASGRVQVDDPAGGTGILGFSSGDGALSVTAADVKGVAFGVHAVSKGSDPVSVKAGRVEALGAQGVAVRGVSSGTGALSIRVSAAHGRETGIEAVGKGSGTVSVAVEGNASSLAGARTHGVHARASGAGSLTVSVGGDAFGGQSGVKAVAGGDGDVSVATSGSVTAAGPSGGAVGIHAIAQGGDIAISASGAVPRHSVRSSGTGILAVSRGSGSVSVAVSVEVTGSNGPGVHLKRSKFGPSALSVSGRVRGSYAPGSTKKPSAIKTQSPSGSTISISLDSGAFIDMAGGNAVVGSYGNTSMTVNSGARLNGRVRLGSGDDALVFDGGPFSGVEEMHGGAGTDTLTFRRGSGALHASVVSKGLKGWERVVVESGASISGDIKLAGDSKSLLFVGGALPLGNLDGGGGSDKTLEFRNAGTATLPSSRVLKGWETIRIGAGSSIAFGGQNRVVTAGTLAVSSGGTLDVGKDSDASDRLTVSGDFAGGGTVTLNANFMPGEGASDRLTVTGRASGQTTVDVSKVGESGNVSDMDRPARIDGVIKVAGGVGESAFVHGTAVSFSEVLYRLKFDAQNSEFDLVRLCGPSSPASCVNPSGAGGAGGASALSQPSVAGGAAPMAMSMAMAAPQSEPAAVGLAGAFVPACLETRPGSGAFSCGGDGVSSPQRLGATGTTALSVKLSPRTAVDTDGTAFSLTQSGAGGIAFERKEGGAAIRAGGDAIAARNAGGGFVSISARGAIAAGGDGVSAISDARGEGVRIDVATVAAGGDGVSVEAAAGGVSVTADDAKGRGAGIRVRTGNGGTGVEISAGSAEGGTDGISVDHGGSGEVRITATGAVSGARGDGVHARSEAGSISVRVSGAVSGGAAAGGAAIRTDGASAAVTLDRGASVRATGSGAAVMDGAGAALVTVREGASILGGVSLGAGADELVLAGGDFGGITALDGGPGRDALRIEAGRGSLPALSNGAVSGVESVIVSGDAVIEGDLLLGEGAGELVFADGARIDGHGRLDGGGGASLSLRGVSGEMDAARLSGWTSLEIGEGSRVTLAGAGLGRDAAESLSVAGTMAFGSDARAGDAFTVEGDFEGGGRVEIDADLAAGSADRLVIEGDVSGTTEIALRDLTPSGAEPSGAEMAVVSVGGEADASAFRLAGGAVARGAFLYDLRMAPDGGVFSLVADGGVSDTGAALRSSDAAIARGLARAATLQARAAARAVASVWARIGSAATFAERGAALAGRDAVDLSARKTRPVWMRLHGDRWDYGAGGAAMIDSSGFEVGMDLLSRESSGGKWIAGLTAQYGTVGAEAAAGGGVGRQGASGYGVGATLSWLGYGGFYADAQAQAGMSDSDFSSDTGGAIRSGVSARTAVAALELGWRVAASDSATIVPQAQISMSGVSGDGFVSGSLDVAESSAASLDGRIGLAAEIALREGYLRFSGSLLRALSELDGTVINGRTVEHGLPDGWAEFAVGGSLDLSEDRVLFLDGTWRTGLGGEGGDAGGASISGGLKVNW